MPAGNTRVLCLLALLAGTSCLISSSAAGREGRPSREALITLGTLTCSLSEGAGAGPAAQVRDILCRFRAGSLGSEETYAGTMQSVGQAEALFGTGTVMLEVKGPAALGILPGLLQQAYVAETSALSTSAPLIGETNSAIVLQPLTREEGRVAAGRTRPEAAIIMVELKLKATPA
jgi:Protein of unknown function (DUF992)